MKFNSWQIIDIETISVPDHLQFEEIEVRRLMDLIVAAGDIAKYPIVRSLGFDGTELVFELCSSPDVLEAARRLSQARKMQAQIPCIVAQSSATAENFLAQAQ